MHRSAQCKEARSDVRRCSCQWSYAHKRGRGMVCGSGALTRLRRRSTRRPPSLRSLHQSLRIPTGRPRRSRHSSPPSMVHCAGQIGRRKGRGKRMQAQPAARAEPRQQPLGSNLEQCTAPAGAGQNMQGSTCSTDKVCPVPLTTRTMGRNILRRTPRFRSFPVRCRSTTQRDRLAHRARRPEGSCFPCRMGCKLWGGGCEARWGDEGQQGSRRAGGSAICLLERLQLASAVEARRHGANPACTAHHSTSRGTVSSVTHNLLHWPSTAQVQQ